LIVSSVISLARQIYYYIRLGRPLFLLGGILLHGLGALAALSTGESLDLAVLIWGQIAITAIQIMTHYSNDYFDLAADAANSSPTRWSGGSRILPDGLINPQIALATAIASGLVGLFAAFWLAFVLKTGPLTLPILFAALVLAWSYSSPPLQLNMHGFGEITGAILISGLTPLVGYYLQAGQLDLLPFLVAFPLSCLQFVMLLVINFPDAQGDASAGKHTLLYFIGEKAAVRLYLVVLLVAYLALPILVLLGLPLIVALALLAISPLAAWQGWRMAKGAWANPAKWDSLGFWSVGLLIASVLAELAAFSWILYRGD
jgi:1,4-dihydroxy-2-naphthoate octaprenyltransferase